MNVSNCNSQQPRPRGAADRPRTGRAARRSRAAAAQRLLKSLVPGLAIAALLPGAASAGLAKDGSWSFLSNSALQPPGVSVSVNVTNAVKAGASAPAAQAPGLIFLAPIKNYSLPAGFVGKPGPEIVEANGNPVWQDPLGQWIVAEGHGQQVLAMNFHTATYEGKPVLVWWQGHITPAGFGNGAWQIVNQQYQTIATINPPAGYSLDFHELQLTSSGNAYIIASRILNLSLTCCGGTKAGQLADQTVFEINVKSGKIVWSWDPLQHVHLRDSYNAVPKLVPWDPYHINSISFGPSGAPIISARNTWAAYWVNRASGSVFATLGGKHSSFSLGNGAHFAWQHDVRQQAGVQISVFDDEAAPVVGKQSRTEVLSLEWKHHTASLVHEYLLPHPALAGSQGNAQIEPNGNYFVGWGQLPFFSEYSSAGQLLLLGSLPGPDESYRIFREPWVGLPATPPSIAVQRVSAHATRIYASWNGATEVASWRLLAGSSEKALAATGAPIAKHSFESVLSTGNSGPYYAVQALDSTGKPIGTSPAATAPTAKKSAR